MDHARAYKGHDAIEDNKKGLVPKGNIEGGIMSSTLELVAPPKPRCCPASGTFCGSLAEMDERCAKGLCDKCDDKYTPDHRCKHLYDCWVDASEEKATDLLDTSIGS